MRVTYTKNVVRVLGVLWMPGVTAATEFTLSDTDIEGMVFPIDRNRRPQEGSIIIREKVAEWLSTHAGDFQTIIDFEADFGDLEVSRWQSQEHELSFLQYLYPLESD